MLVAFVNRANVGMIEGSRPAGVNTGKDRSPNGCGRQARAGLSSPLRASLNAEGE